MADSFKLPTGEDLKAAAILSFLVHHDWDDIPAPFNGTASVVDQPAFITLSLTSRTISIDVPDRKNASTWSLPVPQNGAVYADLVNASGTLYVRGSLPDGQNDFYLRQYPRGAGLPVGRTVIEFYKDSHLTGVFKTAVNNFGGGGSRAK